MDLNNYIQCAYGRQNLVTWEVTQHGPIHNCTWEAVVKSASPMSDFETNSDHRATVNDIEFGRSFKRSKNAAREEAARQALLVLREHELPPASYAISGRVNTYASTAARQ
jgi:hypothetical protein